MVQIIWVDTVVKARAVWRKISFLGFGFGLAALSSSLNFQYLSFSYTLHNTELTRVKFTIWMSFSSKMYFYNRNDTHICKIDRLKWERFLNIWNHSFMLILPPVIYRWVWISHKTHICIYIYIYRSARSFPPVKSPPVGDLSQHLV